MPRIALLDWSVSQQGKFITMVKPLVKPNIVKKRTKPFKRHQCDRKITVKVTYSLRHMLPI